MHRKYEYCLSMQRGFCAFITGASNPCGKCSRKKHANTGHGTQVQSPDCCGVDGARMASDSAPILRHGT
jgi:hypothetical protein